LVRFSGIVTTARRNAFSTGQAAKRRLRAGKEAEISPPYGTAAEGTIQDALEGTPTVTGPQARGVWATSVCAALLLVVLVACSVLTVDRIGADLRSAHEELTGAAVLRLLRVSDLALAASAGCLLACLVWLEWRWRGLTQVLKGQPAAPLALVASAILLWFAHALLAPGLMVTGDAGSHVARINHFVMAVRDGSSLYWDNYFYGGGTSLQFTGPIFHWLAALVSLALGDTTEAVKCVVVAGRFLSAWTMYLFLRRIGLGRTASTLGASSMAERSSKPPLRHRFAPPSRRSSTSPACRRCCCSPRPFSPSAPSSRRPGSGFA
jgi:hypothetical protein